MPTTTPTAAAPRLTQLGHTISYRPVGGWNRFPVEVWVRLSNGSHIGPCPFESVTDAEAWVAEHAARLAGVA